MFTPSIVSRCLYRCTVGNQVWLTYLQYHTINYKSTCCGINRCDQLTGRMSATAVLHARNCALNDIQYDLHWYSTYVLHVHVLLVYLNSLHPLFIYTGTKILEYALINHHAYAKLQLIDFSFNMYSCSIITFLVLLVILIEYVCTVQYVWVVLYLLC